MIMCGKISEKYHGPVSSCGVFSDFPNLTALLRVACPLRLKYELGETLRQYPESLGSYLLSLAVELSPEIIVLEPLVERGLVDPGFFAPFRIGRAAHKVRDGFLQQSGL